MWVTPPSELYVFAMWVAPPIDRRGVTGGNKFWKGRQLYKFLKQFKIVFYKAHTWFMLSTKFLIGKFLKESEL